ncbi:uncharacterized protein BJ171DRAFT_595659 [Polychytrium aggregatum]|uniref:uncharacterized protein n=1 Tax=Polychytrium aggregatum TaxID=110093 RepID=UPI0022FF27B1|nr:uncharacterized protein BJ171DRAFT_595659 [Polychytrium aggregatum]KAI9208514.1 hypothetical protein BJ171DRAFT_595659 [Polychytrium aggregatum]
MSSKFASVVLFTVGTLALSRNQRTKAFLTFLKSARLGCVDAYGALGFLFEFGLTSDKHPTAAPDHKTAASLYEYAAQHGCSMAQARLAFLKAHGRPNVKIDQQAAMHWKTQANRPNRQSIAWLRYLARAGLAHAQFCLAICCYNGIGTPENNSKAFKWAQLAANSGQPGAQNLLGNMYIEGSGVSQDSNLGYYWYQRSGEQGEPSAIYNMGTLYERGVVVEQSLSRAFDYYLRAAILGSVNAQNVLGIFYEQGTGVAVDGNQAAAFYTKAALNGHPHGQYNLARCFHDGFGVSKNNQETVRCLEQAASQNHLMSVLSLGICFEYGIGTDKSIDRAFQCYFQAATHKDGPYSRMAKRRLKPHYAFSVLRAARALLLGSKRDPTLPSTRLTVADLPPEIQERIISFLAPESILSMQERRTLLAVATNRATLHNETRFEPSNIRQSPLSGSLEYTLTMRSGTLTQDHIYQQLKFRPIKLMCNCEGGCQFIRHIMTAME